MKLKDLFLLILCISPVFSFAEERKVEVNTAYWDIKGARSLSPVPILSIEDNILYIYSSVPLENLQVQVKDDSGKIVYNEDICIAAGQKYSLSLDTDFAGAYKIELMCDTQYMYGYLLLD